jgi:RHS repeat-associated protein
VTSSGGTSLSYDPLGRLYQTSASVTTKLQYDGADLIAEYNAADALLRRYVHGPGADEPLVWYEGSGTTDRRWLLADERGSVMAVTDSSGATIAKNSYDEYGKPGAGNIGRFQYTGQTWLSDIGLYYYKARFYSPSLGRFLQPDPIGYAGGLNIYAYASDDPVNRSDPFGLADDDIVITGSIAALCLEEGGTPNGNRAEGFGCDFSGRAGEFVGGAAPAGECALSPARTARTHRQP